ncbi:NAD(P)H-dependent oxidoreductase [Chelatococcus sp. GCM10030263]|uniref:NAD(P)H-dependent oxidoreductase n=1 Tax=Chelatococcus sp. GCM10030263 TaxID=3273387 RepID=UPI0036105CA8
MNLASKLKERAADGRPVRVGLIGAGKFGSMFLAQVRTTVGLHLMAVADLSAERARKAMTNTGWDVDAAVTASLDDARSSGRTCITEDAEALIRAGGLDVVIDATGNPAAGIHHALLAAENGRHMVMVNVEADVLAGAYLAEQFRKAGLVYSLAYGDQPALVCEMVDWAETCGFKVVAAGKGTKYMPSYHQSTPDTVWTHFGITPEAAALGGMNPQMFNSFIDGTKSSIEMAAISNATGLKAPRDGLIFPAAGAHDLPFVLRPKTDGGVLEESGMVEVVTSVERDGRQVVNDLRWGVYVVFEAGSADERGAYTRRCFSEYNITTDPTGRYAALYRTVHLIGLELGVSVAAAALRGEATGAPTAFRSDVVAVAKKELTAGEMLDGEGGYTVWGRVMRADDSLAVGALPIGLAHKVKLTRPVAPGAVVRWDDVAIEDSQAVRIRRTMEQAAQAKRAIAAE